VQEDVDRNPAAALDTYKAALAGGGLDRASAATAQFRIAECYRKLGKSAEAIEAYRAVARQYPDQGSLGARSRKLLADTYKVVEAPPRGSAESKADAGKMFRALLARSLSVARMNLDYLDKQYKLGAISELELNRPKALVARIQGQVAAYDAGLLVLARRPSTPHTPQAVQALEQYRKSLQSAAEFSRQDAQAQRTKYQLGTCTQQDVVEAELRLADAELAVAAFDAGLVYDRSKINILP